MKLGVYCSKEALSHDIGDVVNIKAAEEVIH